MKEFVNKPTSPVSTRGVGSKQPPGRRASNESPTPHAGTGLFY